MPFPPALEGLTVPDRLVAQHPLPQRDRSRMMCLSRNREGWRHRRFDELAGLLPAGALLVINDTRVLPARLVGELPGGRAIEALLVEEEAHGRWNAMVKGARRIKAGMALSFAGGALRAEALERDDAGRWRLAFREPERLRGRLERYGLAPLPPYIRRDNGTHAAADREAYQTCYARHEGAVAAPTAGLHFTPGTFAALEARGIEWAAVTLHVGPGTFRPVEGGEPEAHRMHEERYVIAPETCHRVEAARRAGRPIVAVGTTATRALESWAAAGFPEGIRDATRLFIRPPYTFRVVEGMITNFHQPGSTLLLLVAAFHGAERIRAAYDEAIAESYRFFSYGDCMAILPGA